MIQSTFCFRNPVTFDMQQNIIEELEDWKDKQKILFYEKVNIFFLLSI